MAGNECRREERDMLNWWRSGRSKRCWDHSEHCEQTRSLTRAVHVFGWMSFRRCVVCLERVWSSCAVQQPSVECMWQ